VSSVLLVRFLLAGGDRPLAWNLARRPRSCRGIADESKKAGCLAGAGSNGGDEAPARRRLRKGLDLVSCDAGRQGERIRPKAASGIDRLELSPGIGVAYPSAIAPRTGHVPPRRHRPPGQFFHNGVGNRSRCRGAQPQGGAPCREAPGLDFSRRHALRCSRLARWWEQEPVWDAGWVWVAQGWGDVAAGQRAAIPEGRRSLAPGGAARTLTMPRLLAWRRRSPSRHVPVHREIRASGKLGRLCVRCEETARQTWREGAGPQALEHANAIASAASEILPAGGRPPQRD